MFKPNKKRSKARSIVYPQCRALSHCKHLKPSWGGLLFSTIRWSQGPFLSRANIQLMQKPYIHHISSSILIYKDPITNDYLGLFVETRVSKRCNRTVTQNFSEIAQDLVFWTQKCRTYQCFTFSGSFLKNFGFWLILLAQNFQTEILVAQ